MNRINFEVSQFGDVVIPAEIVQKMGIKNNKDGELQIIGDTLILRPKIHNKKIVDNIVPDKLMTKYHELSDKRLHGELTKTESSELQHIEQDIEKIEESHPVLQLLEQQEERHHQQMMDSLEDISNRLRTLIESL